MKEPTHGTPEEEKDFLNSFSAVYIDDEYVRALDRAREFKNKITSPRTSILDIVATLRASGDPLPLIPKRLVEEHLSQFETPEEAISWYANLQLQPQLTFEPPQPHYQLRFELPPDTYDPPRPLVEISTAQEAQRRIAQQERSAQRAAQRQQQRQPRRR